MSGREFDPPLHAIEGTGGPDPTRAGIGADDALVGLAVVGAAAASLERVRLAPMVGGALRAALDCLIPESRVAMPARVSADGGALEVRLDAVAPEGLAPAGGVLETVEGHVGYVPGSRGVWMVRVPVLAPEETFLLLQQGALGLAIPWHSVVRMRLAAPDHLRAIADQDGYGVLPPLDPLDDSVAEQPVVLVGLGLRRAWLAADRVVWRMTANAVDAAPPRPGMGPVVRNAEGQLYVLFDAARRLRDVPLPPLPHVEPAYPTVDESGPDAAEPRWPDPLPIGGANLGAAAPEAAVDLATPGMAEPEPASAGAPEVDVWRLDEAPALDTWNAERPTLRLVELSAADVEPLDDAGAAELAVLHAPVGVATAPDAETHPGVEPEPPAPAPAPVARAEAADDALPEWHEVDLSGAPLAPASAPTSVAPATAAWRAPDPAGAAPAPAAAVTPPLRALVAEDSIVARIFLVRLLEQAGYEVQAVATGRDLVQAAAVASWTLVFADTDLPDAAAASALAGLAPHRADGTPAPVVALVRDADDVRAAGVAGVTLTLAKPFERGALLALLDTLAPGAAPEPR